MIIVAVLMVLDRSLHRPVCLATLLCVVGMGTATAAGSKQGIDRRVELIGIHELLLNYFNHNGMNALR